MKDKNLTVPKATAFMISPERMKRFIKLYQDAKDSGDPRAEAAADEAMKHFSDAGAALVQMMGAEAAVSEFVSR